MAAPNGSSAAGNQPSAPPEGSEPLQTRRAPRIGRSFSSRNPLPIGAIGLVFILLLLYAAFNAANLPLIGGGTKYTAYFGESENLVPDDDVVIAGVSVGKVESVALGQPPGNQARDCKGASGVTTGTQVKVTFTVKTGFIGNASVVNLGIRTLLGDKYLDIDSTGTTSQNSHVAIPICRTTSPLDVYPAFTKLTDTVQAINTDQLAKAFNTIAQDFKNTPSSIKPLVGGLSRLSNTIASRDAALSALLQQANAVSGTLAQSDAQLATLLRDGDLLLTELNNRRDAIHQLLINTQTLTAQLNGLVSDNQKTLTPMLKQLSDVANILNDNEESLDRGLSLLGPYYRVFNNVVGNGHWFDNYIQNLSVNGILGVLGIGKY